MRKDTYRVDSEQVQGKGSWVELRQITHGEWVEFAALDRTSPDVDQKIAACVASWNWTDRDGQELSLQVGELTEMERSFLVNALLYPLAHLAKN